MTCDEFERVLPELEGGHNSEQEEHLRTCSSCSSLVSDLNAIAQTARLLDDYEPSQQVWHSIEAALRREDLIRPPQLQLVPAAARLPRWRFAWLVPIAAAILFGSALLVMHRRVNSQLAQTPPAAQAVKSSGTTPDEDQVLEAIAARAPAMRASYESNLRAVEAYIRDAELSAHDNPNDQIAQQYLMNAYEQKAMVYEMAMNRALQ
ncbi:MAG TPA: anti-sigma factor [Terriglobales bacterium]|nr:anti-sigma factor [Terriglobales bacterium]